MNQIDRAIEIGKDHLQSKNMGSIAANEPRIVWIKGLGQLLSADEARIKFKFNSELEEILATKKQHYIMDVQRALSNVMDFNHFGTLTGV